MNSLSPGGSDTRERLPAGSRPGWAAAAAFAAVLFLLLWTRAFAPVFLALAGAAVLVALGLARLGTGGRAGRPQLHAGVAVLVLALIGGGFIVERFERIEFNWTGLAAERQAHLADVLSRRMTTVVERGRSAAALTAAAAARSPSVEALFRSLDVLREQTMVDALVVFTEAGELKAWAGEHRGGIPDEVRIGATGVHFVERPLYSYLYFSAPVQGRGERAVAAVLVETGSVPRRSDDPGAEEDAVTETFAARTSVRASFHAGPGTGPGVVWSFAEGRDTVVHARFEAASQAELRAEVERGARIYGVLTALLALVFVSLAWLRARAHRRSRRDTAMPLGAWAVALGVAPLGAAFEAERLYSPLLFVLPSGDLTLGAVLAVLLPVAALVATGRPPPLAGRTYALALIGGALAVAVGYAAAIRLFIDASTPQLLVSGSHFWIGLHVALMLLLTVLTALALPRHRAHAPRRFGQASLKQPGLVPTIAGLLVSALLAVLVLFTLERTRSDRAIFAALWAVPFLLVAAGNVLAGGRTARLLRWLVAGWLAITAVLPHLWMAHLNARLAAASRELESLGVQSEPILEYLLHAFGRVAAERETAGEDSLQLLYRSWVASGLGREPYGAHIILWNAAGSPTDVELSLGGAAATEAQMASEVAITAPLVSAALQTRERQVAGVNGLPQVHKLLAAPLPSGRAVSVTVPPRSTLERPGAVAPFLGAATDPEIHLTLVEAQGAEPPPSSLAWSPSSTGWRRDALVRFPDGDYHAHLEVDVSSAGMRLARGVLLLALDLVLLAALWWVGNAARAHPPLPSGGLDRLLRSFRGRITLALFAFFLVPTALFGWVAYRALAGEVERSARRIAERAVQQAVAEFPQRTSDLTVLAERAGTDVLRYMNGELADVSSPETLELGVYDAWMPPAVFLLLESGEESLAVERQQLGDRSFLLAYHRVRPAGALAVPTALSEGEAAVRQRELAHLILFATLLGGILSLGLSVLVGRALAGPIGKLRRAASAVGAGHLNVRLPEPPGEFGQLFASFNRMTRRLRRARTQELRTARVLAWGEMARQIAHEIKNPLTPIKLAVQHLRRAYRDRHPDFGPVLDENVEQILTEIDRLTEIARAFSRYGAPGELAGPLAVVDVPVVVHEALTLYRAGDPNVRYGEEIEPMLPPAQARSGELKEVILNLLENARTALDGKQGNVTVRAYQVDGRIGLEVHDNGPGIPPELLPRIFEPHFSTRSTGTGLGLAIVRRIVESWGGTVTVESDPGRGTTVTVRMATAEPL